MKASPCREGRLRAAQERAGTVGGLPQLVQGLPSPAVSLPSEGSAGFLACLPAPTPGPLPVLPPAEGPPACSGPLTTAWTEPGGAGSGMTVLKPPSRVHGYLRSLVRQARHFLIKRTFQHFPFTTCAGLSGLGAGKPTPSERPKPRPLALACSWGGAHTAPGLSETWSIEQGGHSSLGPWGEASSTGSELRHLKPTAASLGRSFSSPPFSLCLTFTSHFLIYFTWLS